jgi:hypothetical protein
MTIITVSATDAADAAESLLQANAERLVQREVIVCLSHMVSTLAGGYGELSRGDLCGLAEQASDLCLPIADFEEAATQAGWTLHGSVWIHDDFEDAETSPENACHASNVEPYDREVYEHWAVSTWLAEKLAAKGERVDTDFSNLNVWARTTTGQAISMDSVIRAIAAEMHSA